MYKKERHNQDRVNPNSLSKPLMQARYGKRKAGIKARRTGTGILESKRNKENKRRNQR